MFVFWPPPRVADIDPMSFGITTYAKVESAAELNPYIPRDADAQIDEALDSRHSLVLSAPDGAGAVRTVYEALHRTLPAAELFVPRRPEEIDPAELRKSGFTGPMVLWIDDLGAQWRGGGARLLHALGRWLADGATWLAAICYDGSSDLLRATEFRALDIPVVRLGSLLSDAELAAMDGIYGRITTRSHIGYNPPFGRQWPDGDAEEPSSWTGGPPEFSWSVREVAAELREDDPVTASAIAAALRDRHPEYAGGRFGDVSLDPETGPRRTAAEWLEAVKNAYDPAALAANGEQVIDGRLTLQALAALDPGLAGALGGEVMDALSAECLVAATPQEAAAPRPREHVRWLIDEPVGLDGDRLGRAGVARALMKQLDELVRNYPGRSFLVHIDGAWGTGKSTLLRLLRESVERDARGWLMVEYDAWRQSRAGPPWLTLLSAVRAAVRTTQRWPFRRPGFWLAERARLLLGWQWIAGALIVAGAGTVVAALFLLNHRLRGGISDGVVNLLGTLVTFGTAWSVIAAGFGRFIALDSRRAARAFTETRADPMEDLARHFAWMLGRAGRPVLLLVDDLDRCPDTFVVELLDAVQKLMRDCEAIEIPSLMIVVAADGRWIRQSYHAAYASMEATVREPGTSIGAAFLEKLFQLTVPVPRLSADLKNDYLAALLAAAPGPNGAPGSWLSQRLREAPREEVLNVLAGASPVERVRASATAIDRLVVEPGAQEATRHALEPYAPLLDPTPRGMKRFVMAYSMLRAVRTAEGSVVPLGPLALWTIVCIRWPLLAEYLRDRPDAVHLFRRPEDRLPGTVPAELAALFADPPDGLTAVMNHPDGPLSAAAIRECCGEPRPVAT
ncbi:MAG TPA: P-loop NTPase fold protein [Streptosporangiaceae bacterium]|nr:P-loop NTPase fold protein [Streptosporangiaceae bacterium]